MQIKKLPPSQQEIVRARKASGFTVAQCAAVIYVSRRMWHKYESGESKMHPAFFELFRLKTGQF